MVNSRCSRVPSWARSALGLPRHLHRLGIGGLLGSRFLRLTHTGRRTGHLHETVLEVVHHDRKTGEYTVMSGFGRGADWYRNLHAGGSAVITIGRRSFPATARDLDLDEAVIALGRYERHNRILTPVVHRVLSALVGWTYRGTPAQRWQLAADLPFVALRPR